MDLEFAAVARTGIDLADRQTAPEPPARRTVDIGRQFHQRGLVRGRRQFGQRAVYQTFQQCSAHTWSLMASGCKRLLRVDGDRSAMRHVLRGQRSWPE